jgi:hypothetical protein
MIPSFDKNDLIRLGNPTGDNPDGSIRQPFADLLGVATDPTTVQLQVLKPDYTSLTYNWPTQGTGTGQLSKETTGRFFFDLLLDQDGTWRWTLTGVGTVTTSEEGSLFVRRSPF